MNKYYILKSWMDYRGNSYIIYLIPSEFTDTESLTDGVLQRLEGYLLRLRMLRRKETSAERETDR